jgi:hypothetical protein
MYYKNFERAVAGLSISIGASGGQTGSDNSATAADGGCETANQFDIRVVTTAMSGETLLGG